MISYSFLSRCTGSRLLLPLNDHDSHAKRLLLLFAVFIDICASNGRKSTPLLIIDAFHVVPALVCFFFLVSYVELFTGESVIHQLARPDRDGVGPGV